MQFTFTHATISCSALHLCQAAGIVRRKRYIHRGTGSSFAAKNGISAHSQGLETAQHDPKLATGIQELSSTVSSCGPVTYHQQTDSSSVTGSCDTDLKFISTPSSASASTPGPVKMALLNVRSLANKSYLVNDLISTHQLDFLFLTETWLENDCNATVLIETAPPCFNFFNVSRVGKRGGGVAALFQDTFECKQTSLGDFNSFEYLCIVMKGSPKVLLVVLYRPPKYSSGFINDFSELISIISTDFDSFIITGDFNIHIDHANDNTSKELTALFDIFDLVQHVTEPTHIRGHTLDLVISKGLNIPSVNVVDLALSDHFCVFFDGLITPITNSQFKTVSKRYINENTCALFMENIAMTPSTTAESVEDQLSHFNSNNLRVLDSVAPAKVKRVCSKPKAPWRYTSGVAAQKRECRKAERKWRKTKLEVHHDIFKQKLHTYNSELSRARRSYFSDIINRDINNSRTLFATVDKLTNSPTQLPQEFLSVEKCNEFASFFHQKIENIRVSISATLSCNATSSTPPHRHNLASLPEFSAIDIHTLEKTVSQLNSSTCCLDTLPTSFFKSVLSCLASELLQIVNSSLMSGVFPTALKTAVVKPLLKKKSLDPCVLNNYRPISNLPFIGKVIEKVVFNQTNTYLTFNGFYDKLQSGFRQQHSTETALLKVVNDIRLSTDSGKITVLVLLDLSAAFDTVDHNILIDRLETYVGLSGTVLGWFKSYLNNRDYFVSIGSHISEKNTMQYGVPQGSILGPLLFNLYMLPLYQIFDECKVAYHSYADDTQIYLAVSPNDFSPIESLCLCLEKVNDWMQQNFLQLNRDKTEIIVFGNKEGKLKLSSHLESRTFKVQASVKNLGVIMDSDLSFSAHIKSITKSAFWHLRNISKIRDFVSKQDLEKLIHAFISCRIDYCNALLVGLPQKSLRQVQLIQNAAARLLTKTKKREHITPILKSLHWLPVRFRIDFKILLTVYKSLNGLGPKYITDMLEQYNPTRSLRSSDSGLLVVPRVKSRQGEMAFSYYAAKCWNQLSIEVRTAPTIAYFKSKLKTALFSAAFN